MRSLTVLISGAGIAGATAAHWLARHGFGVTVVEKDVGIRSSGNPVDVRGEALAIVEAMGVLPRLREAATRPRESLLVDEEDQPIARLATQNSGRRGESAEVELSRSALADTLLGSCPDAVEVRFDNSITDLTQDPNGVDVRLDTGQELRFDLVIGADGVHSRTRKLILGEERTFSLQLGLTVATLPIPELADVPEEVRIFNTPGRMVAIHPGRDIPGAAFIFRHHWPVTLDPRDVDRVKQLITATYSSQRWRVQELLTKVAAAEDIYADAVIRMRVPHWSVGRVVLVGDAASSVSLFGDGSSKAIIGAHLLATQLARSDNHRTAFRRYHEIHRRAISSPVETAAAAALLVPKSVAGIMIRNHMVRAIDSVRRTVRPRTRI